MATLSISVNQLRLLLLIVTTVTLFTPPVECKFDSAEVFGPLPDLSSSSSSSSSIDSVNSSSSSEKVSISNESKSFPSLFSLKNLLLSPFMSYRNLSSTLLSSSSSSHPSRQSSETSISDYAVSHPLISDSNARIPLYLYNPGLARKIGLSTLLMTSVIYGLTILPAIYAVTGNLNLPSGLMSSLTGRRRRKRSFYLGTPWELPLLDKPTTEKFLSLLETTLEVRKVHSTPCKRQHLCKVYQWSLKSEDRPVTLTTLERALVNIFGVAAERNDLHLKLVPAVKLYSEAALVALTGSNCSLIYPCTEDINYKKGSRIF
ncbi:uncharacterized protein LOC128392847 [Panonychus citri]|uniref:uncharacterized protein LOC128392847 n=1 Tax=Panonychus citri TaxID=50023 RepID=UPI002306F572|nr:uncharacterized protein LOC128392847 [Panonychus citri]